MRHAIAVLVQERVAEAMCQPNVLGAALVNQRQGANHTGAASKRNSELECYCSIGAVRHTVASYSCDLHEYLVTCFISSFSLRRFGDS